MNDEQVTELLYQALETEQGGMKVYQTALRCAVNGDLKEEWDQYLEETTNHERIMLDLLDELRLDPAVETPGRHVVRHKGQSLVKAMELALEGGKPEAAQLVADEHLYHTMGWARELWIESLGMPAVLPPPEEESVKTAIGAARAKLARDKML
jgi:rubrerythrin